MLEFDKVYLGNCIDLMAQIPSESIDLIATDPPYKVTARGNAGNSGGMLQKDINKKGMVFEHNDTDIEDYLHEFYRVLKNGSHCYIMCNHVNLVHFLKVIDDSQFHFVKSLIWNKGNKVMGTMYMNCFEYILFLWKGFAKKINNCGTPDLLSFYNTKDKNADGSNIHDSQKPIGLMQTLIENSTNENEVVLDPFMGSGTTALAAIRSNRRYIGFEIDKTYYDLTQKRLAQEISQPTLF